MLHWTWLLCWCSAMFLERAIGLHFTPASVNDRPRREPVTLTQSQQRLLDSEVCHRLLTRFPHLVTQPGDSLYERQQSRYWSTTQADLRPACRITPRSTSETSQLIEYLNRHELDISVTAGGHSTVLGASNLHTGITLDLSALSSISVSADATSVSLGPGARWLDVYKELDPRGITVAGGQAGSVGIGGYLLGGGISILAPSQGWSCDTLISTEVVLGNGTIIVANNTHHSDLFSSIKGSGSNFGIVTSFTMLTFSAPRLQLSVLQFQQDHFSTLVREISIFLEKSYQDPYAFLDLSVIPDPTRKSVVAYIMATRFGDIEDSPVLHPFFAIPYTHGSIDEIKLRDLADTVDVSNPYGFRHTRCTFTIQNDLATILAIFSAVQSRFLRNDVSDNDSFTPAMLLEPIYRSQLGHSNYTGGFRNALGLDFDTEPLIIIGFEAIWSQPSLDEFATKYLSELLAHCQNIARQHNSLHSFVYPNYAGGDQDVFGLHRGQGLLNRLRDVQQKYDGTGYIRNHVYYPFKL